MDVSLLCPCCKEMIGVTLKAEVISSATLGHPLGYDYERTLEFLANRKQAGGSLIQSIAFAKRAGAAFSLRELKNMFESLV